MLGMLQSSKLNKKNISMQLTWWGRWWRAWSVLRLLLWTLWVIYRERKRVVRAHARGNFDVQPNVEVLVNVLIAFRQTAIKLGVLMIKLGQFLSSRADLLPERALAVLISLQDEVPPEPFDHVVYVLESELGKPVEEVFSFLERKCAAAASLGQVHKGVLAKTGETVAVKIQRPNIDQLVRMDLGTLKFVIWLITKFVNTGNLIDLQGVYREFSRTVYEEIDFTTEAANALRFKEMFKDNPAIYVPRIYEDYVTRRVIVLEWIDGIKINDYATLDAAGIDRLEAANRTVNAYFYQFFEAGFFHADPHPGNILIKRNSTPSEPIVTFLDFGMVGSVSKHMKRVMNDLFLGVISSDAHAIVTALGKLGFIGEGANVVAIERAIALMLEQYSGMTLGQVRELEMNEVMRDVVNLLYGQPFHIPAQFAFSGRAVSTLVGVATGLAPDFNFIEVATPYARSFLGLDKDNIRQTLQDALAQALDLGRVMVKLPRAIDRLITNIESGQLEVHLADNPFERRTRGRGGRGRASSAVARGSSRASLALAFLASLGGGIYLTSIHIANPGWFCLGLAGLTVLGLIVKR